MSKFKINRISFINNFINPIGAICDKVKIKIKNDTIHCWVMDDTGTVFTFIKHQLIESDIESKEINIGDIKNFKKLIGILSEESEEFILEENYIKYDSDDIRFKYYILDEDSISDIPLSIDKIKELDFSNKFVITKEILLKIIKFFTLNTEVEKIYFDIEDDSVRVSITDKTIENCNNFSFTITDEFIGNVNNVSIPISNKIIKLLSCLKSDFISVFYNEEKNTFIFSCKNENYETMYVTSILEN